MTRRTVSRVNKVFALAIGFICGAFATVAVTDAVVKEKTGKSLGEVCGFDCDCDCCRDDEF